MRVSPVARVALATTLAIVVAALVFFRPDEEPGAQDVAAPAFPQPPLKQERTDQPNFRKPHPVAPARRTRLSTTSAFAPQEVIGNRSCLFRAGRGDAKGLGLVALPTEDGARFEVLDRKGRVLGGSLPFLPNHYRLVRRSDGSIITAFGDLRLNSMVYRPEKTPEPVRIFRDDQLLYEADKVWNFGLAPDGSAFFVVEPTAGSTSRLVIRNLDMEAEHHHDLGYEYTPVFDELPFSVQFTSNSNEVMMAPSFMSGGKSHFFFPATGESPRKVSLEGGGYVAFESMHRAYYAFSQGEDQPWLIQKKAFHWTAPHTGPKTTDIWTREVDLEHFYGGMTLSDNAAWLILNAWVIKILDAQTGATVFAWPDARRYDEEQLARLSTVLPPDATTADIGGVGSVEIIDGQLLLFRRLHNGPGRSAYYFDVFDMAGIRPDSKPNFRVSVARNNRCLAGDFAFRGLQVVNDELTYLTNVRGQTDPLDPVQP